MMQWIREKIQGVIVWVIISVIIIVFVLLSVGSYLSDRRTNDNQIVAKVNGEPIKQNTIDNLYNDIVRQYYSMQKSYNKLNLNPTEIKNQLKQGLINQMAVVQGLQKSGFKISADHLLQKVKSDPKLQENGVFSMDKYTSFLRQIGLTELQYQQSLKEYLLVDQLNNSLILSDFVPLMDLNNFISKWYQTRSFGFVLVPFKKLLEQKIDEQEIVNYYNTNKQHYINPDQVKIEYLEISAAKLLEQIIYKQDELYKYYQEHKDYYTLPELMNVRHILISAPKGSTKETSGEAKTKIESILAKIKAGADFIKLAKEHSEDPGSATKGGDLGWIGKDETEVNFEKAAFSLKNPGDISEVVQSIFGYHIIQFIEKREAKVNTFEQAIEQITKHYKEEQAQLKLQNIVEELANATFENESLSSIADKFNLKIQQAGPFTNRGESAGIASYSEVLMAAFDKKHVNKNSDLIKLAEDRFVIIRVTERQNASEKTLEQAYNEIKATLQTKKAKEQAKKIGLEIAEKLLISTYPNKVTKAYDLEWNLLSGITRETNNQTINPEILRVAFSLTTSQSQKSFTLENGDFVVVRLLNINDANLEKILIDQPNLKNQIGEQLVQLHAVLERKLYEDDLIAAAKIKYYKDQE